MFRIFKYPGQKLIKKLNIYGVSQLKPASIEFYSNGNRYVFTYNEQSESAEIWKEGDFIYGTENSEEAFQLYLELKCQLR